MTHPSEHGDGSQHRIRRVVALNPGALAPLVEESERAGWRFVRRLAEELHTGANLFDGPGECLLVVEAGDALVGVCGLNADPYVAGPGVGRVRHLYVLEAYRGAGVGRRLVEAVVTAAAGHFRRLRLRTENPQAGRLYERVGFEPAAREADCTHVLELGG